MDDSDDAAEAEIKKFFPTVDMRNVQILLYAAAVVIFILAIIQLVLGSMTDDTDRRGSETVSGVLALMTSIVCVYSSYAKDRGGLQLAYLLLIWLIANGAQTFFTGLSVNNKLGTACGTLSGATDLSSSSCNEQRRVATGQSVIAVFLFFTSLGTAWLVSNFSEKIQDNMSNFQRERDIRFAIENQALKDRVAKRWKKAYQKVIQEHEGAGHRAMPPLGAIPEDDAGAPPVPNKPHRRLPPVDSGREV